MSLSTNTTYRVLLEKLGGSNPNTFIGDAGELFYNPSGTTLKISDGSTPGGVSVAGAGGGGTNYWNQTAAGINTLSNVGIGTTNPTSKLTVAGQFQSTGAGSTLTGGGQIYLNGNTSNRIDFNENGMGYPSNTTRSAGTKIVLYPGAIDGYEVDSAIGIAGGILWQSVPYDMYQFKWYAGTSEIASLGGGRFSLTGVDAYISGNTGIGTDNTTSKLEVQGGDIKVGVNTSRGLILTSPNGTKYRLIVDNSGVLSTVLVP